MHTLAAHNGKLLKNKLEVRTSYPGDSADKLCRVLANAAEYKAPMVSSEDVLPNKTQHVSACLTGKLDDFGYLQRSD